MAVGHHDLKRFQWRGGPKAVSPRPDEKHAFIGYAEKGSCAWLKSGFLGIPAGGGSDSGAVTGHAACGIHGLAVLV